MEEEFSIRPSDGIVKEAKQQDKCCIAFMAAAVCDLQSVQAKLPTNLAYERMVTVSLTQVGVMLLHVGYGC
jgi:hypothetical protein